jgi:hypothetical protein
MRLAKIPSGGQTLLRGGANAGLGRLAAQIVANERSRRALIGDYTVLDDMAKIDEGGFVHDPPPETLNACPGNGSVRQLNVAKLNKRIEVILLALFKLYSMIHRG